MIVGQIIARASCRASLGERGAISTRTIFNCCCPSVWLTGLAESLRPPDLPAAARSNLDGAKVSVALVVPLLLQVGGQSTDVGRPLQLLAQRDQMTCRRKGSRCRVAAVQATGYKWRRSAPHC